jgi:tRNA pseudouridine55 synthase
VIRLSSGGAGVLDGVLVIDKPQGITSHDVVAVARRALGEKRIGHTGTLDPLATGVLPLACGRATRLVRFLSAADKDYEAVIRFGMTTDSYDMTGAETSRSGRMPAREDVERGLTALRGEYAQVPPAFSAKRIGRTRAYTLARREEPVELKAVPVRVTRAELTAFDGATAVVAVTCSAGFYVRTFAHVLGELAGTGACLGALRRTRSGDFAVESALTVEDLLAAPARGVERLIPMDELLPWMPAAHVTEEGHHRVVHGREVEAAHLVSPPAGPAAQNPASVIWVRLMDADGRLLALGTRREAGGPLHPNVVLI